MLIHGGSGNNTAHSVVRTGDCVVSAIAFYFIPSSESSAYLKQIKGILSAVKKCRIFSLVTNTIFIFSLQQTEAVSTFLGLISSRKDLLLLF